MWKGGKENVTPKKNDTAPRVFPNPPPVLTTPIKHFFKVTPSKASLSGQKPVASPAQRISIATPSKASISSVNVTVTTPTRESYTRESISAPRESIIVHSPSFTALQKRVSSPAKSPKGKSPKGKSPKAKSPKIKSPAPRESVTPLAEVRSANNTPSKFEDTSRASIDYYEKVYNIGRPASTSKGSVTLRQEEWHNMISGLLEQVQEKDDQLMEAQERVDELEESVDNMKRENFMLRDEIREKNAELTRLATKAGDKELAALQERLSEERKLTELEITKLKSEIQSVEEKEIEDNEEVRILHRELQRAREESREYCQEVERLSKKLTHKNSEIKMYKNKVESFLGNLEARTTPSKGKRKSSGMGHNERKKSRSSISRN